MPRTLLITVIAVLLTGPLVFAERAKPEVVATIDGADLMRLLPVGGIPAIDHPEFVKAQEAESQMRADEPVLGVVIGDEARAYSLWQLDAHEIVNDIIKGSAIAVTW